MMQLLMRMSVWVHVQNKRVQTCQANESDSESESAENESADNERAENEKQGYLLQLVMRTRKSLKQQLRHLQLHQKLQQIQ
jgi:hypothetical protein